MNHKVRIYNNGSNYEMQYAAGNHIYVISRSIDNTIEAENRMYKEIDSFFDNPLEWLECEAITGECVDAVEMVIQYINMKLEAEQEEAETYLQKYLRENDYITDKTEIKIFMHGRIINGNWFEDKILKCIFDENITKDDIIAFTYYPNIDYLTINIRG